MLYIIDLIIKTMRRILLLCFGFIAFVSFSQNQESITLLKDSLANASSIEQKIAILDELAWQLRNSNYDQAESYARKGIELSNKNFEEQEIGLYNTLGLIYKRKNDFDNSIINYKLAVNLSEKLNKRNKAASSFMNIGILFKNIQKYDSALFYYEKAFNSIDYRDNPKLAGRLNRVIRMNRATVYSETSLFEKALNEYLTLQTSFEESEDTAALVVIYTNIANIHSKMRDYNSSLKYHRKSLIEEIKLNNPNGIAQSYADIGISLSELKKKDSALYYFNKSLKVVKAYKLKDRYTQVYYQIAEGYIALLDFEKAQKYFSLSLKSSNEDFNINYRVFSLNGMAISNLNLGKLDSVPYFLERALKIPTKKDEKYILQNIYDTYSLYYYRIGNLKKAAFYNDLYKKLIEENFQLEKRQSLAAAEVKYQTEKKEKENLLLKQENLEQKQIVQKRREQNIFLSVLTVFIFVSLLIYIFINRKLKIKNATIISQKKDIQKLQNEAKHRTKNNYSVLQGFFRNRDVNLMNESQIRLELKEQTNRIKSFSYLESLFQEKTSGISFESYFAKFAQAIHSIFFQEKNVKLHIDIAPQLNVPRKKWHCLALILNEFMTNTFKHASLDESGEIKISLVEFETHLELVLSDNGVGFSEKELEKNRSRGLYIIEGLVSQIESTMSVKGDEGTVLTINIPKNE